MRLHPIFHENQILRCYGGPNELKIFFWYWCPILNYDVISENVDACSFLLWWLITGENIILVSFL